MSICSLDSLVFFYLFQIRFGFFVNLSIYTRFCLVSLTFSYRKTSYRSLKQMAGSTVAPSSLKLFFMYIFVRLLFSLHNDKIE